MGMASLRGVVGEDGDMSAGKSTTTESIDKGSIARGRQRVHRVRVASRLGEEEAGG